MSEVNGTFKDKVSSFFRTLGKEEPSYEDAKMLVGSAESEAKLVEQTVLRSIDTGWLDRIEEALPYLDTVIRNPTVAIENIEEVLPLEMSRNINEQSIKHLAQHTNLILDVKDEEIIPSKILNVYRDETYMTYENKFVNTLLSRLCAFVDRRYSVLKGGGGAEKLYKFDYQASFEHYTHETEGKNSARVSLSIELNSPITEENEGYAKTDGAYKSSLARVEKLNRMLTVYRSSQFAQKMGRSYIRPPVIRTNAILKNKNMKECLKLWEYIESFEGVGYSVRTGAEALLPSDDYIRDMYSGVALQYLQFYEGITRDKSRLLSKTHQVENMPDFSSQITEEELSEYMVYDAEYKKTVSVSLLASRRKKLSEDERLMLEEISVALKADSLLTKRRKEEEARLKAEENARKRAEEEAKRREEEELRRIEEENLRAAEEKRRLEEERRIAEEEARRLAEEQARKLAEEQEKLRIEAERTKLAQAEFIRYEKEREAARRAEDIFFPENGDLTGRYPICPYTRAKYASLPRKTKKQVKKNMEKVLAYREITKRIEKLRQGDGERMNSELPNLLARKAEIRREFPEKSRWAMLLDISDKA